VRRLVCLLIGVAAILLTARKCAAQIDPEHRALIEFGYNQPLLGHAPLAAYGYLYLNEPDFLKTNVTLRLAIAPVYLDSELGLRHFLGPNTDLAFGLAGGGFADDYFETHDGNYYKDQSFDGHVAEATVSIYHLFNPDSRIPLNGVFRVQAHYSVYARDDTAPNFVLPNDHSTFKVRTGLRWGGREPVMHPDLAMEISAWWEGQFRTDAGPYGYDGDRQLEPLTEMYWGRALLVYTFPESKQSFSVSLNGGGTWHADRFDAYRLGGDLPLASEFPLVLPGYFYQELSAKDFVAFTAEYTVPLDPNHQWTHTPLATVADVDYLPGAGQPGNFNSGVGVTAGFRSKSGVWQTMVSYGYGFEAIRDGGRGGQSVAIMCQIDLTTHPGHSQLSPGATPYQGPSVFQFLRDLF
jgi:hypothetical protein